MKTIITSLVISLFFMVTANSEIIYTDIVPDTVVTGVPVNDIVTFPIDLDKDGNAEFYVGQHHYDNVMDAVQFFCTQYGTGEVLIDGNGQPLKLAPDAQIDVNQSVWHDSKSNSMDMSTDWPGLGDKFIGLRFYKNSHWYYGWVRVNVASDVKSVKVKDFAYQKTPETGIKAGETEKTGVTEILYDNGAKIIVKNGLITINRAKQSGTTEILLFNNLGMIVAQDSFDSDEYHLTTESLLPGVYFCRIKSGNFMKTQKFLKIR